MDVSIGTSGDCLPSVAIPDCQMSRSEIVRPRELASCIEHPILDCKGADLAVQSLIERMPSVAIPASDVLRCYISRRIESPCDIKIVADEGHRVDRCKRASTNAAVEHRPSLRDPVPSRYLVDRHAVERR